MKKILHRMNKITLVTGLLVALCLLFSCAKMSQPEIIEGDLATGTLDLYVTVGDDYLAQGGGLTSLRAIAPSQLGINDLTGQNYSLELTATSLRKPSINMPVNLNNNGRASLTGIPLGTWDLELVAKNNTQQEVLKGNAAVIVDGGETTAASFTLRPVEGGTGTVSINFTLNADDFTLLNNSNATVQIDLYNPLNYSLVNGTNQTPTLNQNFTYNPTNAIPAGMYIIKVTFTAGTNNSTALKPNSTATWADTLYIEGTRTTEDNISLPQLLRKPSNPTVVAFTNEDPNVTTGHITGNLTWGGVYNANSYKLEILEYTGVGIAHPRDEGTWTTAERTAGSHKIEYNADPNSDDNYLKHTNKFASQYYRDGGLLPGQNSIRLWLEVGTKRYAARMKAVNSYGDSAWVYFTELNPQIQIPTPPALAIPANFGFAAAHYDAASESFYTNFTWGSVAEADGYELELMTIKSSHNFRPPTNNQQWDSFKNIRGNTVVTYRGNALKGASGDPCQYKGGSLLAGSTSAQVSIKRHAGKEYYVVRLRAYSDDGRVSDWRYPSAQVPSAMRNHPMLLMPIPSFSYTSTPADGNRNFTATITIQDHPNSTCYYHYEFIHLSPRDFSSIFSATDPFRKNDIFRNFYNAGNPHANSDLDVPGPSFQLRNLSENNRILVRVRILTWSGTATVSATPWYYATKTLLPGQTDVSL